MRRLWILLGGLVLTAAGCGTATSSPEAEDPGPAERPTAVPAAGGLVTTTYAVLVLDDTPGDRPRLCLGGVADSDPPQCQGIPIAGWDWTEHEGTYETRGDVRYGSYALTGTFDGTTLTVIDAVSGVDAPARPETEESFVTPCPEPAAGWVPADPERSGERSFQELQRMAQARDDFALLWVDQSINPAHDRLLAGASGIDIELQLNDPRQQIVNIQVTGDPVSADADFRTVWGGSLCVTQVQHTEKELLAAQQETTDLPGFQGSSGTTMDNRGELTVTYDDGSYQRWLDATYGEGAIVVTSALTPVGQPAPTSG